MNKNDRKPRQFRRTLLDTLHYQELLRNLIDKKIEDDPILTINEKKLLPTYVASSFLSEGSRKQFKFKHSSGWLLSLGSIHSVYLKMIYWCDKAKDNKIILEVNDKKYEASLTEIWKQLREISLEVFPEALSEGLLMSKEADIPREVTAHTFSLDNEERYEDE